MNFSDISLHHGRFSNEANYIQKSQYDHSGFMTESIHQPHINNQSSNIRPQFNISSIHKPNNGYDFNQASNVNNRSQMFDDDETSRRELLSERRKIEKPNESFNNYKHDYTNNQERLRGSNMIRARLRQWQGSNQ